MSFVCSCRIWKSAYADESSSENISSWPRLFTIHTKRTWRVTAPFGEEKSDERVGDDDGLLFSLHPCRMSRRSGTVNVAPVLPASSTTLSNWRRGLWHPYGPSMVTVFNLEDG